MEINRCRCFFLFGGKEYIIESTVPEFNTTNIVLFSTHQIANILYISHNSSSFLTNRKQEVISCHC